MVTRCSLARLLPSWRIQGDSRACIAGPAFARLRRLHIPPCPFRTTCAQPPAATATIPNACAPELLLLLPLLLQLLLRGLLQRPRSRSFPLRWRAPTPLVWDVGWGNGRALGRQVASRLCSRGTTWMAMQAADHNGKKCTVVQYLV